MKPFEIKVGGQTIPCRLTMAAMSDFKDRYNKEATEVSDAHEILGLIFFCARAEAERRGEELAMTERQFRNALDPDEAAECINAYNAAAAPEEPKKKTPKKG